MAARDHDAGRTVHEAARAPAQRADLPARAAPGPAVTGAGLQGGARLSSARRRPRRPSDGALRTAAPYQPKQKIPSRLEARRDREEENREITWRCQRLWGGAAQ